MGAPFRHSGLRMAAVPGDWRKAGPNRTLGTIRFHGAVMRSAVLLHFEALTHG